MPYVNATYMLAKKIKKKGLIFIKKNMKLIQKKIYTFTSHVEISEIYVFS